MCEEKYQTIDETINEHFELSRKFDEYFPIYLKVKDNSSEIYILDIDYSAEVLDLENSIKSFDGDVPLDNIIINVKSLFSEIKFRILALLKNKK